MASPSSTIRALVLALCAGLCAAPRALAEPSDSPTTSAPAAMSLYARPARLVRVEGRRRLNLVCIGEGSPVVVLEAGLGDNSLTWAAVQGRIAAVTKVCAYDRAGYGFSDPAERPSNAANNVDDLQRLLINAGLTQPVVLVAHSLGGLYATLFASRYRRELAGMILIDPSFAEQNRETFLLSTPAQRAASDERLRGIMARSAGCLARARKGQLNPSAPDSGACLPTIPDPALNAILRREYTHAKTQAANLSEILSISSFEDSKSSDDSRAIDAADHDFGDLPLVVLTRGNPAPPPPFFDAATQAKVEAAWKRGHDRLAAYSRVGRSLVAPPSDHYIQRDQPAYVAQLVIDMVRSVRTTRPGQAR